jgi:hypothetical protein
MKEFETERDKDREMRNTLTLFRVKRAKKAVYRGSGFETTFFVRDIQCLALAWIIHFRPPRNQS